MTKDEYFKFHAEFTEAMTEITRRKNADYSGTGNSPFDNFTTVERNNICSTETGFLTRMSDKMSRLTTFVHKGVLEVKDESITDTLSDLANYCILMAAYIESKRGSTEHVICPVVEEYNQEWGPEIEIEVEDNLGPEEFMLGPLRVKNVDLGGR